MTDIFKLTSDYEYGEIHFKHCQKTGMKAIIAIHSTKRGPALGGCRFVPYGSSEDAIIDALKLGQGMSYKAAMANLPLGGGKAVIIKPKEAFSREEYMLSFGAFVESLQGRYITALDSGTELSDMDIIATQTHYIASRSEYYGDPSPHTVHGVMAGIRAACFVKFGQTSLKNLSFAIQGLGHVGHGIANLLHQEGAKLYLADINKDTATNVAEELHQTIVSPEDIHKVECDVFVPCALGGVINSNSINQLNCKVIAGAANNQLQNTDIAQALHQRQILYVPDYIINSGGLIYAAGKYLKHHDEKIEQDISAIYQRIVDISHKSINENIPPSLIVDHIAKAMVMN